MLHQARRGRFLEHTTMRIKFNRAQRRTDARRVAAARRAAFNPWDQNPWAEKVERAPMFFEDRGIGCSCRKRHKGQPKTSYGLCCMGQRDRIYTWRHLARRINNMVAIQGILEDDLC